MGWHTLEPSQSAVKGVVVTRFEGDRSFSRAPNGASFAQLIRNRHALRSAQGRATQTGGN